MLFLSIFSNANLVILSTSWKSLCVAYHDCKASWRLIIRL